MKRGFTLVELSIVLVIIGLLIGGILVAQSMIGTAKIQSLVRQVGQFDAALANFQTKYNQLPGDSSIVGSGDNNGIVNHNGGCGNWPGEMANYWNHLSLSGLTNPVTGNAYTVITDLSTGNKSAAMPTAATGIDAYFMIFGISAGVNYYFITHPISGNGGSQIQISSVFTPVIALAIDQKIDDGAANSGNIIGFYPGGGYPSSNGCGSPNAWQVPISDNNCATANAGIFTKLQLLQPTHAL